MRALRTSVAELTDVVAELVEALGARVLAPGPSSTRGGRGGRDRGRTGGLGGEEHPTRVEESELSDVPSNLSSRDGRKGLRKRS